MTAGLVVALVGVAVLVLAVAAASVLALERTDRLAARLFALQRELAEFRREMRR